MAEKWSELPIDLLREIQTHLTSPFYTVRFRSVCSTWRHAVQSNAHNHSTSPIPLFFSKRTILLLSPPPTLNSAKPISWIIKIEEIHPQRFNLFYPLSRTRVNPVLNRVPMVLDVSNTRINELGLEFCFHGSDLLGDSSSYKEKVAFLSSKNDVGNNYMFLTFHISGKLALFDVVSMEWNLIDEFQLVYDDVISFNGDFYAVDNDGRTVVVVVVAVNELDSISCDVHDVHVVALPFCGGDKKLLVEMRGELMLVDVYIGFPPFLDDDDDDDDDDEGGCNVVALDEFMVSRSVWFKVYRLDRDYSRWVEVKDLGNNVLFLGINSAFSASADELYWDKGNCICFNFPGLFPLSMGDGDDEVVKYHCGGVYHMEDSSISFAKVFWPPPSWVASSS